MKPIFLYLLTIILLTSSSVFSEISEPNRLFSKLAYADEVQGVDGAQKLSVQELLDASSPGATQQFAAEVEFGQKSNISQPTSNIPSHIDFGKDFMEFITIGDPGNTGDVITGCLGIGAVEKIYQIGKYEVTASEYCIFLNAVASKEDPHQLYKEAMSSDQKVACITRTELTDGSYAYSVIPGREKLPITYVNLYDAERFCNWLENGAPANGEDDTLLEKSTESGAYLFKKEEDQEYTELNPDAHYYLPSENEWVKAAYYKGKGTNSGYWLYPTQHDFAPNNGQGDETNQANYKTVATLWKSREQEPTLTSVDRFNISASSYGTCDMGGNVAEWTSDVDINSSAIVRGGSWKSEYSIWYNNELMRTASPQRYHTSTANNFIGFRVASVTTTVPSNTISSNDQHLITTIRNENVATMGIWGILDLLTPCPWCLLSWLLPFLGFSAAANAISSWREESQIAGYLLRILMKLGTLGLAVTAVFILYHLFSHLPPLSIMKDDCMQFLYTAGNLF
ncbi:MAG: hypothetical protein A3F67_07235 [Verrucomicrobia bacterium RIFCSPHIGHO2_12_FULL_41_10]|nr:MAG: hypothetical protein A3F67_07235 [Verrucomicrobia bacterium RIFCSPHIGHO2_12_FULL_41_10]HLB34475.1 SUMF1/EgtB/PvdO family nonheme iron enzyme [Chthoniobacterales bacterium]